MSETLHAEAPLANSTEARTPTGELKNQVSTSETTTTTTPPKEEPKTEPKVEAKTEPKVEDKSKTKESLLNKKDEAPPGAPEKYEPFAAPEGYDLNPEVITKAEGIFKELGLNQDQAQRLVSFYAENAAAAADAPYAAYEAQRQEWQTKVKADPEIGKILPQVKQTVSKALDLLGSPALTASFKQALDVTGIGDHPDFIKGMYKLASLVTEGGHVRGGGPAETGQTGPNSRPKSAAAAIFPNLPSASG